MKKSVIILMFYTIIIPASGNNIPFIEETKELVLRMFSIGEFNPIHQPETEKIQKKFQDILIHRNYKVTFKENNPEIDTLFKWLYDNSYCSYEDSPDIRRYKMRRALCFASVALLSDYDKAYTFIEYAKLSIIEHIKTPDVDLLENQYLGVLLMDLMLKMEEHQVYPEDLKTIENYLMVTKGKITKENYMDTNKLLTNLKKLFA